MININDKVINCATCIEMQVSNINGDLYECQYFHGVEVIHKKEWYSLYEIKKVEQ